MLSEANTDARINAMNRIQAILETFDREEQRAVLRALAVVYRVHIERRDRWDDTSS